MELSHFICVVKYSLESPKTAREVPSAPAMLALWRVRNQRLGCKTLGRQIILKMAQFSICGTFYVLKKKKTACCQILFHLPTDVANSCKTCHLWHTIIWKCLSHDPNRIVNVLLCILTQSSSNGITKQQIPDVCGAHYRHQKGKLNWLIKKKENELFYLVQDMNICKCRG